MPESDFDSVEGIIRGLAVCINGAAAVANIVPLTAILRTPRLLSINEVALNMSLIISDFCLSSMMTMAVATGWGNHGAFLDNRVVCQLQGIATQVFSVVSILTLLLISVNNYLVIVLEWQHLTRPQIAGCVVVSWAVIIGWACLPLAVPGGGFVKQPSEFYCELDATSTHPAAVTVLSINICAMTATPALIGLLYTLIVRKLWISSQRLSTALTSSSKGMMSEAETNKGSLTRQSAVSRNSHTSRQLITAGRSKNLQLQIALVKRALSLVLVFLLSWGAYVIMLIVEYANGKPVTQLTEAVVFLFPSLNALLNPIVLVLMDRRYREAVHVMFGQNPKP
ncbi:hypothetical protein HK105_206416 [Polyrhizophydium stewartii]|uniref:G-protein coupled receptors family 1 profile domain-containing protein n=1 Tax=Polyrhizophydium stewartii TaxID=2732419 RepID=A0ABR4MVB0_9FUNG